jgi:hypothetical protein
MVAQRQSRVAGALAVSRHPLRRRIDNLEAAALTVLVVVFVLAAPLAGFLAGRITDIASLREQRAEHSWHQADAVLQEDAAAGVLASGGAWDTAFVLAAWPAPGRGTEFGQIAVQLNARAGDRVPVFVNGSGELTHAPLSSGDVRDRVLSAALAAVCAVALLLGLTGLLIRVAAGRRRLAGWAHAWAAADPACSPRR